MNKTASPNDIQNYPNETTNPKSFEWINQSFIEWLCKQMGQGSASIISCSYIMLFIIKICMHIPIYIWLCMLINLCIYMVIDNDRFIECKAHAIWLIVVDCWWYNLFCFWFNFDLLISISMDWWFRYSLCCAVYI